MYDYSYFPRRHPCAAHGSVRDLVLVVPRLQPDRCQYLLQRMVAGTFPTLPFNYPHPSLQLQDTCPSMHATINMSMYNPFTFLFDIFLFPFPPSLPLWKGWCHHWTHFVSYIFEH